ncbi:MAG: PEGA domain-containing protein [Elusimicrobia bacterium]|nr:PEGA domain-containing protein [Elusimicrobiota bacterium]
MGAMKRRSVFTLAAICVAFSGCASIVSGRTQEVSFNSNPSGATVTIDGRPYGTTPVTTMLHRESGSVVVFSKPGYKPLSLNLETTINGWFWGNIVTGGVTGSTTDGVTGAIHEYSPGQYMATLEADGTNGVDGSVDWSKSQKVRDFIVTAYSNIMSDLSHGGGQYLDSLIGELGIPESGKADAVKKIKALSEVYTNIPDFADQVIGLYLKH